MDISSIESELAASTTDIESLRKELEELTNRFKEKEAAYQKLQAELEQKKNRVNDYQMQLKNITMREQSSDDSSNSLHGSVLFIGSYKNSPIAWRVVDEIDNRILLISEEIIECRWFDRKSNKYQNSEIRSWLNNDFLKQVFLAGEAAYIVPVQYTECTNDKIFLLSKEEIIKYFPTDLKRRAHCTKAALANGLSVANFKDESGEKSSCYWVRDEAKNPYNASCVFDNGSANNVGISYSNGRVGIRPAMWVRIK